jgi:hypothetical protein
MPEGRFAGAITTPDQSGEPADGSIMPGPPRPGRPPLIELAGALLIIGGLTSTIGTLGTIGTLEADLGLIDGLLLGLAILTVVVGFLVRAGRAWVFDVNVVAVVLFLELTALPSASAILFATIDAIVLIALIRHRRWFDRTNPAPGS